MRISDWSSDVCSSDLIERGNRAKVESVAASVREVFAKAVREGASTLANAEVFQLLTSTVGSTPRQEPSVLGSNQLDGWIKQGAFSEIDRSEEHTSELQSLMRISYAVFCLKKKNK